MLCDVSARKFGVGALHDSFKSRHEIRKKYDSEFTGFPCNYLTGSHTIEFFNHNKEIDIKGWKYLVNCA